MKLLSLYLKNNPAFFTFLLAIKQLNLLKLQGVGGGFSFSVCGSYTKPSGCVKGSKRTVGDEWITGQINKTA